MKYWKHEMKNWNHEPVRRISRINAPTPTTAGSLRRADLRTYTCFSFKIPGNSQKATNVFIFLSPTLHKYYFGFLCRQAPYIMPKHPKVHKWPGGSKITVIILVVFLEDFPAPSAPVHDLRQSLCQVGQIWIKNTRENFKGLAIIFMMWDPFITFC